MRFELHAVGSLAPLAWCARLRRGQQHAVVWHGPWVEVFGDGFAEGAWDGPFTEGRFEDAVTFTGTGARARPDHVLFASATNSQERIHLLRRGDELFVSNSLPFALVAADDGPDPRFLRYEAEFLEQGRLGIFRERRTLPTRRGRVTLHECANLVVTRDLEVTRIEKPAPAEPRGFADYTVLIEGAMAAVFANASDASRCQTYRPIATLSTGYDSNALAALARRHGCREAATFAEEEPGVAAADDGSAIGEILGYGVKTFARRTRTQRRPCPEAEFCVCPPGGDRTWLAAEEELPARIFLSGRHGDIVLSGKQKPHAHTLARSGFDDLGGATMNEYRLRVGYLNFAPWFTGWQHADALRRIARSPEMSPWSIGGSYDRPVARRILEEAGVPRHLFGQHKRGGAYEYVKQPADLCDASRLDYLDFVRSLGLPRGWLRRMRLAKGLERVQRRAARRVHIWSGGRVSLPRLVPRRYRVGLQQGFLFHWGFERVRSRYRLP